GSPHAKGSTAVLADAFCEGALSAGHHVERFDAGRMQIGPCLGCMACRKEGGRCVRQDDMEKIRPALLEADAVVFVTPIYYFGMTAQLKAVIDRFFACNADLRASNKKAYMISVCGDAEDWVMDGLRIHFTNICRYLNWEESGRLLAEGFYDADGVKASAWPEQARALGASL
ncbi:MAG: flavodoxin family protein, partial [Firmicutes bacterium]|nr:flavodoxin family protein [Bacillota bacterium]